MKKINRIRKSQEFTKLIHEGRKIVTPSFVFYCAPKMEKMARIGISVSKKAGHAVDRNLYKRQVRMMCQDLIDFEQFAYDVVLILRIRYTELSFQDNKKNLEKALDKAKIG